MKLREGYKRVEPKDITEVHMNDKILAVRCGGYMLLHRDIDNMIPVGSPTPEESYFGGQWIRIPIPNQQAAENFMTNMIRAVTQYRDRMIADGASANDYRVSALMEMKVIDIGRISSDEFKKTFDTGINFGVAIGKTGEHGSDNQSTK